MKRFLYKEKAERIWSSPNSDKFVIEFKAPQKIDFSENIPIIKLRRS